MTTLYTFDSSGYHTGQHTITNPYAPQPAGTTTAPPTAPEGQVPLWTGQSWLLVDVPVAVTPQPVVPQSVSRFQARAALFQAGLFGQVETLMAHVDTPMIVKLAWSDAQEFRRSSPTVLALAGALDLTEAQLDNLFISAAGIEA